MIDNDDPSVMYKIITKMGLSFDYYDMYQSVKNEYDNCRNKSFYHFHQAFAVAGGDADSIVLPREIKPEMVVFAKYLILNQMSGLFTGIMRKGTETYNADHYSDTPVIFDGMIAKFATAAAVKLIDNEKIELMVTDGDRPYYLKVTIDNPEHAMTDLYIGFAKDYNLGRFSSLIQELIKHIDFLESDLLRQKYQESLKSLKVELNAKWEKAGRQEKETIGDLLRILNERLETVSKFLSDNYQA